MKLEFVEVEGFRGFRERVRFEIPASFLVIAGRNGVGKSTILDAVDFALTGSINKYEVEKARGGGLQDHIWWLGEGLQKMLFFVVRNNFSKGITQDIPKVLGRPPISFEQFVADYAECWTTESIGRT